LDTRNKAPAMSLGLYYTTHSAYLKKNAGVFFSLPSIFSWPLILLLLRPPLFLCALAKTKVLVL